MADLDAVLKAVGAFLEKNNIAVSKGKLCTVLFLTRRVIQASLPFPIEKLRTTKQGQVAGLGPGPIRKILIEYGITRSLGEEGGRTSRGSLGLAEDYAKLLNDMHASGELAPALLKSVEEWWIERVGEYFNRQCFKIDIDPTYSISKVVALVLTAARDRQKKMPHSNVEGTVLQHLVGAKLTLALGMADIKFHKASEADGARAGDFELADSAIHVTTAPSEQLIEKCQRNLKVGLRPIVVCPQEKAEGAAMLADNARIKDRVEVYNAETFISMNINEMAQFKGEKLKGTVDDLLKQYNRIVDEVENDTSLRIERR